MPARITGTARTPETRAEAARLGLCEVFDTAAEAVKGADLVILCVPVGAMEAVAQRDRPASRAGRHRQRRRLGQACGDRRPSLRICPKALPLFPATRWPGPSIPARPRVSLRSSTTAGAC
jgi:hypothetical protein